MPDSEKVNILIVDDKANNIFAIEEALSKTGRNFFSATNGKEALRIVLNTDIDLIILDVQMPDMDGFEVAQILKSNKRTKDIPIIFASAEKKDQKFMLQGLEEGAIDYLYKPLDQKITEAKVSVLLHLHLRKKELVRKNFELEKYALLINNSADLICIINNETFRFEEVNNAVSTLLGYTTEEIKGTSVLLYLAEEDRLRVQQLSEEHKENFSFETRIYSNEGAIKWLNWNIVNKNGLWFANARDITQQKKSDEEIKQLNNDLSKNIMQLELINKDLESFSYFVSHDLKAPLRRINSFVEIIQDHHALADDELKRLFGVIHKNASRMGILVDDLLDFSRLGRTELIKAPVNFNELVSHVLKDLEDAGRSNESISVASLKSTDGDKVLLYQVFMNLVSNAIKYSSKKAKPEIEIGFSENSEEYIYYVKDNGTGFSMEEAHKLFEPFQRLHSKDEFEGTGVGLAIVHRIVQKHNGRLWAEGEEDKGATFYFSLPKPTIQKE